MPLPLEPRRNGYWAGNLNDGTRVLLRELRPEDAPAVSLALAELSTSSRYQRFLGPVDRLSPDQVRYLTEPDGVDHLALGMALCTPQEREGRPIGIARCIRIRDQPYRAEVAVVIADDWQNLGAGSLLFRHLHALAWGCGIRYWEATLLADNLPVSRLLDQVGTLHSRRFESPGIMEVAYALRPPQ